MKPIHLLTITLVLIALAGCATTETVELAKSTYPTRKIQSVAQVIHDGNSPTMNGYLDSALAAEDLVVRPSLPRGTATSTVADALVSYDDVWRWDLKMYLESITIEFRDAKTGDLLVIGHWNNSTLHTFPNAQAVVKVLVSKLMIKLRARIKSK